MTTLPLSNIINVTITNTPQGSGERNVNSLALFTTEEPSNIDPYGIYVSASQVATDYGTDSITASMASAIFSQNPNILAGNGRLVIVPLGQNSAGGAATSATSGELETANLSTTLANILLVSNGDIKFTIDGVAYNLTGLNFTLATTWADVAAILQAKLVNAIVAAVANGFTVTSKKVGTDSTVAIAAVSGGSGTDLNGAAYFKGASATTTAGSNAVGETLEEAITRTKDQVFYCGVITNLEMEDAVIEETAAFIQALNMILFVTTSSTQDIAGLGTTIKDASETRTRVLLYTPSVASANLMKAAYTGRLFSTNFNGSDTASTMNLKRLTTITADTGISQTNYTNAKTAGVDMYVSYLGNPGVCSTGGNEYVDVIYAESALKIQLEDAGFNFLAQTNTKIPQTENGVNGLKNAYAQVCERFVRNGTIAPGRWTSSETFGNPVVFRQNIEENGYYIYSTPVSQQDPIERAAREAPLVQIAIKLAGAIHTSDVIVVVNP